MINFFRFFEYCKLSSEKFSPDSILFLKSIELTIFLPLIFIKKSYIFFIVKSDIIKLVEFLQTNSFKYILDAFILYRLTDESCDDSSGYFVLEVYYDKVLQTFYFYQHFMPPFDKYAQYFYNYIEFYESKHYNIKKPISNKEDLLEICRGYTESGIVISEYSKVMLYGLQFIVHTVSWAKKNELIFLFKKFLASLEPFVKVRLFNRDQIMSFFSKKLGISKYIKKILYRKNIPADAKRTKRKFFNDYFEIVARARVLLLYPKSIFDGNEEAYKQKVDFFFHFIFENKVEYTEEQAFHLISFINFLIQILETEESSTVNYILIQILKTYLKNTEAQLLE